MLVFSRDVGVQPLDVIDIEATQLFQVPVGLDGGIELFENAPVVNQQAMGLLFMQAVDPRNGLDQVVTLQGLIDVEHRVARLVEARQQFVHYNQ